MRGGSYKAVQQSLREGWAPVNATDAAGYTALMRCCVSGHLLEVLLGCEEVDVNASSAPDGSTALLLAARHRSARTVHALLRRGAAFTRDASGCSVLHKAAANSDPAVVRLLLQAQADPCARDREGRCPLATAMLQCNEGGALALLLWQQSWAARDVLRAAGDGTTWGTTRRSLGGGGVVSSAQQPQPLPPTTAVRASSVGLDALPDDCLELILHMLADASPRSSSKGYAGKAPPLCRGGSSTVSGGSSSSLSVSRSVSGESADGGGGLSIGIAPPPSPLTAATAAMGLPSMGSAAAPSQAHDAPATAGAHAHLCRRAEVAEARSSVAAMACACSRFRAVCRRRLVSAWLATEGVNASVACYHPRGQHTTLLHLAAAEGMDAATELLLQRGACPLALDSCGRTPLQVARGRAPLVAMLTTAQARAAAEAA